MFGLHDSAWETGNVDGFEANGVPVIVAVWTVSVLAGLGLIRGVRQPGGGAVHAAVRTRSCSSLKVPGGTPPNRNALPSRCAVDARSGPCAWRGR